MNEISPDIFGFLPTLPYPVMVVTPQLRIVQANQAAEQLFEQKLMNVDMIRILRQPDAMSCVNQAALSGAEQSCDLILWRNTQRTFKMTAAPLGQTGLICVSLLDISASIAAERSRSTFVANVSHELRSPLAALLGAVETLQGPAKNDPAAQEQFLNLMQNEAQRMSRLVGDLLSLAKLESQEHIRPDGRVDVLQLIKSVESSLSASHPDYQNRIKVVADDDILPIIGTSDELTEVFQNIIENALKYSAATSPVDISVQAKRSRAKSGQNLVIVTVTDYGDGIEDIHIPRLTERFYRVDKGRSREKGGTGLGLAITKHILNRHRARLHVASQIGEGTTVTVTLRAL